MGTPPGRIRTANPKSGGFTLLELMIVVVLVALILALGVPGFGEFMRNNRLAEASNGLIAAAQLARTEAIKRQVTVSVCASADPGAGEAATCSAGAFTGWLVFADPNGDCVRDPGETRIASEGPNDRSIRARAAGFCAAYGATGFTLPLPEGTAADRVLFCDERGIGLQAGTDQSAARGIVIARTGRTFLTRDPDVIASWGFRCP
jgi:type IV fimbrial biogenesis protein FimT